MNELKKMYNAMGEAAFLARMKEQLGQDLPVEIVQILRQENEFKGMEHG